LLSHKANIHALGANFLIFQAIFANHVNTIIKLLSRNNKCIERNVAAFSEELKIVARIAKIGIIFAVRSGNVLAVSGALDLNGEAENDEGEK